MTDAHRKRALPLYVATVLCALCLAQWAAAARAQAEPSLGDAAPPPAAALIPDAAAHTLQTPEQHRALLRSERLTLALSDSARVSRSMQTWSGVSQVILGGTSATLGILVARNDEGRWGRTRSSASLAGAMISIGAGLIIGAIAQWIADNPAQRRFERWSALPDAAKNDPARIARFEGQLEQEAESGTATRLERVPLGIGFIVGGATLLSLTAAKSFDRDARTTGYVLGACYAGIGALQIAGALLTQSLGERIWERYKAGEDKDDAAYQRFHLL
jgi:hypothetical protein